jgi:hypothetical protein
MNMKTIIGIVIGIAIAVLGFVIFSLVGPELANAPKGDGSTTTNEQPGNTNPYPDQIMVDSLSSNAKITSPLTITGKAKGWYFEASFPINILDQNGKVIGQAPAQAQSDWMTSDWVPFKAVVTFTSPGAGKKGIVRLSNDNPSGLPENDKHIDHPRYVLNCYNPERSEMAPPFSFILASSLRFSARQPRLFAYS